MNNKKTTIGGIMAAVGFLLSTLAPMFDQNPETVVKMPELIGAITAVLGLIGWSVFSADAPNKKEVEAAKADAEHIKQRLEIQNSEIRNAANAVRSQDAKLKKLKPLVEATNKKVEEIENRDKTKK